MSAMVEELETVLNVHNMIYIKLFEEFKGKTEDVNPSECEFDIYTKDDEVQIYISRIGDYRWVIKLNVLNDEFNSYFKPIDGLYMNNKFKTSYFLNEMEASEFLESIGMSKNLK